MVCIGVGLSVAATFVTRNWDTADRERRFQTQAREHVAALKAGANKRLLVVASIRSLFVGTEEVSRDEFRAAAGRFLARLSGIQALEWIPRVPHDQRQAFEAATQADGFEDFRITERAHQGEMVPARRCDEYFPVYYVEPLAGNEAAFGFDLASNPERLAALKRSRDTGRAVATGRIILVQETGRQYGFIVYDPVYRRGAQIDTVEARRENLLGFALGVFRVGDLATAATADLESGNVEIRIHDNSGATDRRLLYCSRTDSPAGGDDRDRSRLASDEPDSLHYVETFDVAGRQWAVLCTPGPAFADGRWPWESWAALAAGLAITGLGAAYLRALLKHRDRLARLNRRLREEIEKTRLAAEQAECLSRFPAENPDPVLRLSSRGMLEYANAAADPVLPRLGAEVGEPVDAEWQERIRHVFAGARAVGIEFQAGERTFAATLSPVVDHGYVNLYAHDITERKRLEEQLHLSQRMEAIGRLAGGVAHDFNNYLTGIVGYADMVAEEFEPESQPAEDVAEIIRLARRAAELTDQLLAFSRRQPLHPEVMNINACVEDMTKMLRRVLRDDIHLEFDPAPDLGNVRADPARIEQVLMNLAVNARDAMPDGGALTIETANVELDQTYADQHAKVTPGPHVMLAVSDTGCGMDAETRQRLFEPFYTTKEGAEGTGLGLATVYGIVKQHGGNIWVYSEPGEGTTFKIYLPRVQEPVQKPSRPQDGRPAKGTETVLLVEDQGAVLEIARRTLEGRGYHIVTAGSAEEAETVFAQHPGPIDLLLTDVVLPGRSGRELYERLKRRQPDLSVLFMSGYTNNDVLHRGVIEKEVAFIQKPFTPDSIAQAVRAALGEG
ncbi:MAG: CHASE domain-containing protein [Planctomycetota bacterium]